MNQTLNSPLAIKNSHIIASKEKNIHIMNSTESYPLIIHTGNNNSSSTQPIDESLFFYIIFLSLAFLCIICIIAWALHNDRKDQEKDDNEIMNRFYNSRRNRDDKELIFLESNSDSEPKSFHSSELLFYNDDISLSIDDECLHQINHKRKIPLDIVPVKEEKNNSNSLTTVAQISVTALNMEKEIIEQSLSRKNSYIKRGFPL